MTAAETSQTLLFFFILFFIYFHYATSKLRHMQPVGSMPNIKHFQGRPNLALSMDYALHFGGWELNQIEFFSSLVLRMVGDEDGLV